jgi:hypothetical protein
MKLRIRGQSLRLRLTRQEVSRLVQSGTLEETTVFGPAPDARLTCFVGLAPANDINASFLNGRIAVTLPADQAAAWAAGEAVGLYAETEAGLKIAVEKDFRCLEPRRGEDDSDAFERPTGYAKDSCGTDEG